MDKTTLSEANGRPDKEIPRLFTYTLECDVTNLIFLTIRNNCILHSTN